LVKTDVSEERVASIFRVREKTRELRSLPEDGLLHSHRRENLKSYISISSLPQFSNEMICFTKTLLIAVMIAVMVAIMK
jgi:hypothetical protein